MESKKNRLRGSLLFVLMITAILAIMILLMIIPAEDVKPSADSVTTLYYADNISSVHKIIIDRFNEEFRGRIRVIPINLPFSKFSTNERKELLARSLRGKSDRVDLFTVDIIWVPRFAKWCEPLESYFPPDFMDGLLEHVRESCYWDGRLVAMPLYTDIGLMYYRRDILMKLPDGEEIIQKVRKSMTWDEFIALHERMQRLGMNNPFYIYPADNFEGLMCSYYEGLNPGVRNRFTDHGAPILAPSSRRTVGLLVDLVWKYGITPPEVFRFDEYMGNLYAIENNAVFFRGWPGFVEQHQDLAPESEAFDYVEPGALPHFEGAEPAFVYGGWNFMISKYSRKKEEAARFIRFALEELNQRELFLEGGYIPVRRSVYADSALLAEQPVLRYYSGLLKHGIHRPYLEDYTKISDIVSYYVHSAIKGDMDAEEALARGSRIIRSREVLIR